MSKKNTTNNAGAVKTTRAPRKKGAPSDAPNELDATTRANVAGALAALEAQTTGAETTGAETTGAAPVVVVNAVAGAAPPTTNAQYVLAVAGAGADALGGRVGARTHFLHVVLCEAAQHDEIVTSKVIGARANALASAKGAPPVLAHESHLNTMKGRVLIERVNGAWRLTNKGRELVKLAPNKS